MNIQSKILKDLLKYAPQTIIPAIIAFISIPIYTRIFPPTSYGNLNIVRASIDILKRCSAWIGLSVIRYYSSYENENKLKLMFTSIIKMNFIIGFFVSIPILIALNFMEISSELKLLFIYGMILFIVGSLYNSLNNVLRVKGKINRLSLFILSVNLFGFLISLGLIFIFDFKIESILIGNILIIIILLPILWQITAGTNFSIKQKIHFDTVKKFASYGIPLTIGSIGAWVLSLSDRYIIKILLSSHEVGVYSACYNITWNALFLIVNAFYMMEQPLAIKIFVNNGDQALREFINHETRLFLIFIIPSVFLMYFYSETIFSFMVAEEYRNGIIIVPYIATSIILNGLIFKFHLVFLAFEKTKSSMYILLISATSNIIFNVFLIPCFGIVGAAIATLISYTIYFILVIIFSKKIFHWSFPFKSFLRISAMAFISVYTFTNFFDVKTTIIKMSFLCFCSIILYVVCLTLTGEINKKERDFVKKYLFFRNINIFR